MADLDLRRIDDRSSMNKSRIGDLHDSPKLASWVTDKSESICSLLPFDPTVLYCSPRLWSLPYRLHFICYSQPLLPFCCFVSRDSPSPLSFTSLLYSACPTSTPMHLSSPTTILMASSTLTTRGPRSLPLPLPYPDLLPSQLDPILHPAELLSTLVNTFPQIASDWALLPDPNPNPYLLHYATGAPRSRHRYMLLSTPPHLHPRGVARIPSPSRYGSIRPIIKYHLQRRQGQSMALQSKHNPTLPIKDMLVHVRPRLLLRRTARTHSLSNLRRTLPNIRYLLNRQQSEAGDLRQGNRSPHPSSRHRLYEGLIYVTVQP